MRIRFSLPLLAISLLAFALRVHWLDHQSLWGNEAWTLHNTNHPSVEVLLKGIRIEGVYPPLSFLTVWGWVRLAGRSLFALRFSSAIFGALTAPLLGGLGKRLRGAALGLPAAGLLAISPFHLYYGQELRAYAQLTLWAVASYYLLARCLDRSTKPPDRSLFLWIPFAAVNTLLLYTHYFGAFVLAAQVLYGAGWLVVRASRRRFRQSLSTVLAWAASYTLTALAFAPWVAFVWQRVANLAHTTDRVPLEFGRIAARLLSVFGWGASWQLAESLTDLSPWLIPFVLLLLIGSLALWRARAWFLLTWLVVPILGARWATFAVNADWTRFFIAASPAFYLLVVQGALDLGVVAGRAAPERWRGVSAVGVGGLALAPVFALQLPSLANYYGDPAYARPDYAGTAARIAATPHSVVVQDGDGKSGAFSFYYTDRSPYFVVPADCSDQLNEQVIEAQMRQAVAGRRQVWLLQSMPLGCDPKDLVPRWLAEHIYPSEKFWLENVLFTRYLNPAALSEAGRDGGRLGDSIDLIAWRAERARVAPGETLAVSLTWVSSAPQSDDYHAFVFLANEAEQVAAIHDAVPGAGYHPSPTWPPNKPIDDLHGLLVAPGARPGDYWLGVGLYDSANGQRLPVTAGEGWLNDTALRLMPVQIEALR